MTAGKGGPDSPDADTPGPSDPVRETVAVEAGSAGEVVSTVGAMLAGARPKDPIGMVIARSRMAARLFESSKGSDVGRFQLLDRMGAGGMGVIYAAYDPELERAVAVKLVYIPGQAAGGAIAEAKALARLSHPNVVTIFDYGFVDDHLYIVMELVLGQTLRRWVKRRSQREIVKAYHQAGQALAAAHAAALVHRDFKPDNAIMGGDGRVRVVDFGLACEAAQASPDGKGTHRIAGTPGYMAPEQAAGNPVTFAADQYGFCTALQEALRERDERRGAVVVPRWLQAIIDRGRAADPADRFPSMAALLHELGRDPVVAARRRIAVGALALAGLLMFLGGRATLKAGDGPCEGSEARLAGAWGEEGRDAALDRIAKFSPYAASLRPRLEEELGAHARRWAAGYRDACAASVSGVQSRELTDRRMACLERGRSSLRSVAQIVRTADGGNVADLSLAVHALPNPEACADLEGLLSEAEAPSPEVADRVGQLRTRVDEARVQIAAGRSHEARPVTDQLVTSARALAYKPLLSEALLVQGHAMLNMDQRLSAIAPLTESSALAFEAGLFSLAVEAWARRAWAQGTSLGGEQAVAGLEVVEAVAARRATSSFSRALLHNNVGCVQLALERRDRARLAFERASVERRSVVGEGAAELLIVDVNLGLVIDDPAQRDRVLGDAATNSEKMLGADHPETLHARWLRGSGLPGYRPALEILTPTCTALEAHGAERAQRCWMEVAFLRGELRDLAGAVSALRRAESVTEAAVPLSPLIAPYLLLWGGDADGAARGFIVALKGLPARQDDPWWDRFDRADLQLGLGRALRVLGRLQEAKTALLAGLAGLREAADKRLALNVDRRVARARAEAAEVMLALHASPAAVSTLAEPAAAWLRRAGGLPEEIAALERLGHRMR